MSYSMVPLMLSEILQVIFRESENTQRKIYVFEAKMTDSPALKKNHFIYIWIEI